MNEKTKIIKKKIQNNMKKSHNFSPFLFHKTYKKKKLGKWNFNILLFIHFDYFGNGGIQVGWRVIENSFAQVFGDEKEGIIFVCFLKKKMENK